MEDYKFKVYNTDEPDKYGRDIKISIILGRYASETPTLSMKDLKLLHQMVETFIQEHAEE